MRYALRPSRADESHHAAVLPRPWMMLALGLAVVLFGSTGCSHYRLGPGGSPTFRTVYVEPVQNKTMLPQAREIISTRLREAFARDARLALVNAPDQADVVLTVVIADYHRDVAAVREGDTGLARKFELTLGVDCTLRQRDGTVVFSRRRVEARRQTFTDGGQLQSEYQTLPLLADVLAQKVVHATLDTW